MPQESLDSRMEWVYTNINIFIPSISTIIETYIGLNKKKLTVLFKSLYYLQALQFDKFKIFLFKLEQRNLTFEILDVRILGFLFSYSVSIDRQKRKASHTKRINSNLTEFHKIILIHC